MVRFARFIRSTAGVAVLSAALAAGPMQAASADSAATVPTTKSKGWSDQSYYLPMRDGVRIAVSLHFPNDVAPSKPTPVILVQTRYGRASGSGGRFTPWLKAGYVIAVVDTRGSTASFGQRKVDIGPEEVRDMDEIIAHLASRPWSSGQVIAWGFSYLADTADWTTSRPAPALVAAVPRETDFDAYLNLFFPGGVTNDWFLWGWSNNARNIDLGRDPEAKLDCRARAADCAKMYPTLQPVDEDKDYSLMRQAMADRKHWGPEDYADTIFRDDQGRNGYTIFDSSPAADLAGIRKQRKPVQYWGSWMDAGTAEAALARFRSAPEAPAEIWITAHDHGQTLQTDPFAAVPKAPVPSVEDQFTIQHDFQQRALRREKIGRTIHYYVLSAQTMRQTDVWPPVGVRSTQLALTSGNRLIDQPAKITGVDRYEIDYTASTGKTTRWSAQGGPPADYPDRREADRKLIVYDGPAQTQNMELVGTPVVTLHLASTSNNPAVFVYLEDVAPDGRVTYITEGQLLAIHRQPADPKTLPYDQGPAPHSFRRADALPVVPNEVMQVQFALQPVAALIRKGHRVRVAIAGTDADTFRRYPKTGSSAFMIHHGGERASHIELPLRRWQPTS
jgi:uncharacterized protein